MDKRTLLFMLCIAATFFFVNYYFTTQNDKKQSTLIKQQELQKAKKKEEEMASANKRIANVSSFPLVEIFKDGQGNQVLSTGIEVDGSLIALAWSADLPETIYAKPYKSPDSLRKLKLVSRVTLNQPVLYTSEKTPALNLTAPSNKEITDVQIVEIPSENLNVNVYLGEYKNGQFSIPFAGPKLPSFIFAKTSQGYSPFAIYDPATKILTFLNAAPSISQYITLKTLQPVQPVLSQSKEQEKFFVLENEYMQLVFSNYGGALAEINLPFESDANNESVVREIEFDRVIKQDYPFNDHFPAKPYYTPGSSKNGPFVINKETQIGGYYPLIRRSLVLSSKGDALPFPPKFYALNVVSDYPEVAELVYEVKEFDKTHIVFEAVQSLRRITKTFSLVEHEGDNPDISLKAPYMLSLKVKVDGDSRGLALSSGIPEVELMSGGPSPILKYRISRKGKSEVSQIDLPKDKETITVTSIYPDWISNSNGYLGLILNPVTEIGAGYRVQAIPGTLAPTRLVQIDQEYQRFKASEYPGYNMLLPLSAAGGEMDFRIFAGPYEDDILKEVDTFFSNAATGYNPDYAASQSFHGWFSFISEPFAKFLFILLNFFHSLTHSWAFSIVLLTVALRVMLYPLNAWSFKSMRRMQEIAPEVAAIQAKYKKDQRKSQMEIMNLYREKKVNPFTGCFPILIQMPFLIGMFDLLKSTFELRGASFIPGWIDNLTAPDVLFSWSYPIFFIGNEFHLLPILLGAVMFLQQKMSSTAPKDKALLTDQQKQQKMMGNIMVIVFSVMFYHFPSGLNIYWLSSMLLGILQQWFTNKQLAKAKLKPAKIH